MRKKILYALLVALVAVAIAVPVYANGGPPPGTHKLIDIKPASCPNPLNVKSGGVLPVAVVGYDFFDGGFFDVARVDPASVRLEGVAPLRWNYEDAATAYYGALDNCGSCTSTGADGFMDLILKFDKKEIVAAIGEVNDGDCVILTLTGEYDSGSDFWGQDMVKIIKKGKNNGP